jgi:hypothetical protein
MKRHTAAMNEDSLELLLDTICNTFGGIIFISLLVVILLSTTSDLIVSTPPPRESQVDLISTDITRDQLTRELKELKRAVAQQQKVSGSIVSAEILELVEELKRRQSEQSRLLVDKSETVGETTKIQDELNKIVQDAADRKSNLSAMTSQSKKLLEKLAEEIAERSRAAIIPKMVETQLPKRVFFLTGQKLYGPVFSGSGVFNKQDFIEPTPGKQSGVQVSSSGGMKVELKGGNEHQLVSKFQGITSASFVIQIFVWPDSFEHFETVRLAAESSGLKYELTPCQENTVIQIGTTDAADRTFVQ